MAPVLIVRSPETVSDSAVVLFPICNVPLKPCPIVSELSEAFTSNVTMCPLAIVTSAFVDGTTPPTHVAPVFQFPVFAEMNDAATSVARLPDNGELNQPSVTAYTFQ